MNPGNARSGSLASAARGPVLMIVIGGLFAIDHAGGVSIARTWPVILVVLGAMRLWQYLEAKQA
jgi:hypothetical protein